jgi:hypothetical protein
MRYHEIQSGLRLPVSSEEWDLIDHIRPRPVDKDSLDERQQELARMMVSRGLLNYFRKGEQTFYRVSSVTDIWRDRNDR